MKAEEKLLDCQDPNTNKVKSPPSDESIGKSHKVIENRMKKQSEEEQFKWEDPLLNDVATNIQAGFKNENKWQRKKMKKLRKCNNKVGILKTDFA